MTYGAYALSDSGSGVLWGDFTDTYYYRGYIKFTGTNYEYSFYHPGPSIPVPDLYVQVRFINNTQEGESAYLVARYTVWLRKYGDNDLIFVEPKDAACLAVSIQEYPVGSFSGQFDNVPEWQPYAWWFVYMSVLIPKSDFTLGNTANPYIYDWNYIASLNRMPIVHIFTTFDNGSYPTTGQGLAVYRANGSTAYNSAQGPLRIKDIIDVSMPQEPAPYQYDMNPVNTVSTAHASCSRPMYHFPSLAQAVQEYAIQGSSTVSRYFGLSTTTTTWSFVFYVICGGGFQKGDATHITTKWITQGAGFFGTSQSSGSLFFGLIPNGSSAGGSGTPPFRYNSVNFTGIPVLVADASDYPYS
jgi:hypothetical protein